jgi:hypothetical protein
VVPPTIDTSLPLSSVYKAAFIAERGGLKEKLKAKRMRTSELTQAKHRAQKLSH